MTPSLLLLAPPAWGQAELDWTMVTWNDGDLTNSYTMSNGVDITITVTATASGSFDNPVVNGGPIVGSPYVDGPGFTANALGGEIDLGVVFDPDIAAPGSMSPVLIEVEFSEPVSDLSFEISDIDFSPGDGVERERNDEVVITCERACTPLLSALDPTLMAYEINGTTATAVGRISVGTDPKADPDPMPNSNEEGPPRMGTLIVDFEGLVSKATITYNETSGFGNPAARGIGVLAMFTQVPVELMSFTVE